MADKAKRGRPKKIDGLDFELVFRLAELGLTDRQIAHALDLCEKTINNYKKENPDFLQSIKNGKALADAKVEKSLYLRACGYEHPEDKFFQHEGKIITVPTIKHYPPDTAAAFIWLKNRKAAEWKDKSEVEVKSPVFAAIEEIGKNIKSENDIDRMHKED